jgi:hypothetical protein
MFSLPHVSLLSKCWIDNCVLFHAAWSQRFFCLQQGWAHHKNDTAGRFSTTSSPSVSLYPHLGVLWYNLVFFFQICPFLLLQFPLSFHTECCVVIQSHTLLFHTKWCAGTPNHSVSSILSAMWVPQVSHSSCFHTHLELNCLSLPDPPSCFLVNHCSS